MKSVRGRLFIVVALTLWGLYSISPSIIYFSTPKEVRNSEEAMKERLPEYLPQQHVKLGLDLQGGVQLVLGVSTEGAVDNRLARVGTEAKRWSDDGDGWISNAYAPKGEGHLIVELNDGVDTGDFKEAFFNEFLGLRQEERDGQTITFTYEDEQIRTIQKSAIEQAERVVRNRVDQWGVSEPVINRRQVDNSILVQLPGFSDTGKAKDLLGRTAVLSFKLVDDEFRGFDGLRDNVPEGITVSDNGGQVAFSSEDRDALLAYVKEAVPQDREVYVQHEDLAGGQKTNYTTFVVEAATEVGGEDVMDAFVTEDSSGLAREPVIALRFSGPGGKRFGDVTGANVGRRLAIVLDDELVMAPNIQTKIANGQATITLGEGGYNEKYEEASTNALILKSGAIPAKIEVLEERQVGASLGPELADQGIKGLLVGLSLVFVFMLVYYRRPGMIACSALLLNGVFLLALMGGFGFALTLPGIAGFILTLGMAVDANVLINERIRQEVREGKNAKKAIEAAFNKVKWTIIDANVTTLIAALVLLETNSSGPIRGFAITLMLGLIVSMFTSLFVTKVLFEFALGGARSDKAVRAWLGGDAALKQRKWNVNFLSFGKIAAVVGALAAVSVISSVGVRGLNWGVDFAGGTEMMIGFSEDVSSGDIEALAAEVGIKGLRTQNLEGGQRQYLVRFGAQAEDSESQAREAEIEAALVSKFSEGLKTAFAGKNPEVLRTDFVGPQIGQELRVEGVKSVFWAMLGVLIYIAFRFDLRFAPGAIVKMVVDIFLMMGFYAFFWRSFDLTSVAAFLTVVGYSVNDTIVIYDRIRENMTTHAKRALRENINISLNETLTRTINTSVTTIVSLMGILFFASGQIWNFAAAMTIGVVAATLSSQFLASSFVMWLANWRKLQAGKKAGGGSTGGAVPARG